MKEKRLQKISDFDRFYDSCETIFTNLRDNDSRAIIFQNEYMLCICPGSRAGGDEKRVVEIFWGARAYEFETKGKQWKSYKETGATLFFYRNDTGDITVSLYPAKTEFRQPIENHIALYEWLNPKKLNNKAFIQSLWNDFIAYMECTSLDGKPTFYQRLRISYLRNFKHLVIDNKWRPTKFSEFTKDVFKWVLTVGLSGIIIYVLTQVTQPPTTETEIQLKEVNKNLEIVSKQLDKYSEGNSDLKTISITTDSIAAKTKEILQVVEKHKTK
jgi:hypothetical protein